MLVRNREGVEIVGRAHLGVEGGVGEYWDTQGGEGGEPERQSACNSLGKLETRIYNSQ